MSSKKRMTGMKLVVVVLLAIGGGLTWAERSGWLYVALPQLAPPAITSGEPVRLERVSDGDTVKIRYHDMRLTLRLRNVDTEESVHSDASKNTEFGRQTSSWAKNYLSSQRCWVEFHRKSWHIDTDHHGRALGLLWIERGAPGPDDDELYNETLIRLGYSAYVTRYGTAGKYHQRLVAAEQHAREKKLGIWR